ncbi:phytanoyl-CoA dioxygenase family protein [Caenimonas soli]|uniref:phytanoyl-CoA dioxygenase family protein n=1 Tax=Caenimonas soli TaxID=2735555 RepID=UPI00155579FE|nr:phytanoyl-CoA dioxygenase family protein [Caenimonas soli]NPC57954.1 phytanoyl-CoA dioxygenase family protein [Caenimonas soli]
MLTSDAIREFWDQGFLVIPQICTPQEVDRLCDVYDRLFAQRVGWQKGDFFDFAGPDTPESPPVLPQLLDPSRYEPSLKKIAFRTNALAIARQLLGPSAELVFEHAMLKPPRIGAETPWHQDEAFYPIYTNYQSITFWMPLQPVDRLNGCMEFIAGSHAGPVLPHRRINNDPRLHGLEVYGADVSQAVSCPLPAGGATVHHCRTLHHAGPNLSEGPRRAYSLGFGVRSRAFTLRTEFPWNAVRTSARDQRADEAQGAIRRYMSHLRKTARAILR